MYDYAFNYTNVFKYSESVVFMVGIVERHGERCLYRGSLVPEGLDSPNEVASLDATLKNFLNGRENAFRVDRYIKPVDHLEDDPRFSYSNIYMRNGVVIHLEKITCSSSGDVDLSVQLYSDVCPVNDVAGDLVRISDGRLMPRDALCSGCANGEGGIESRSED